MAESTESKSSRLMGSPVRSRKVAWKDHWHYWLIGVRFISWCTEENSSQFFIYWQSLAWSSRNSLILSPHREDHQILDWFHEQEWSNCAFQNSCHHSLAQLDTIFSELLFPPEWPNQLSSQGNFRDLDLSTNAQNSTLDFFLSFGTKSVAATDSRSNSAQLVDGWRDLTHDVFRSPVS